MTECILQMSIVKGSPLAEWMIFNMSSCMITIYSQNQLLKEPSVRVHLPVPEECKRPSHRIIELSELEGIQGSSCLTLKGTAHARSNLRPWRHWHYTLMGRSTKPKVSNKIKHFIFYIIQDAKLHLEESQVSFGPPAF